MHYKIFNHSFLAKLRYLTPCYIYDQELLQNTLAIAKKAATTHLPYNTTLHYAVKANDNRQLLKPIAKTGFGADCVSGGEINKALKAGFDNNEIVFAGVGKQDWEIKLGLKQQIGSFNVESINELEIINSIAAKLNTTAQVVIRINPDIDAKTHKHIATGKFNNKFGIAFSDLLAYLPHLKNLAHIKFTGLHYHIGSQITDLSVFTKLATTINSHYHVLKNSGHLIKNLNLGGGLGINYLKPQKHPIADFDRYFQTIATTLDIPQSIKLHFELGRSLVAQCGILLSTVLFTKTTANTNFAVLDAGMNDLIRPSLYGAKHHIYPLNKQNNESIPYNIVGPVCESADSFAKNLVMPTLHRGDKIVIESCGAYGRVLSSQYNSRKIIKEHII